MRAMPYMRSTQHVCSLPSVLVTLGEGNATLTLSVSRKYCLSSSGVMLNSASTACKRPQVFLSFCKQKVPLKTGPNPNPYPKTLKLELLDAAGHGTPDIIFMTGLTAPTGLTRRGSIYRRSCCSSPPAVFRLYTPTARAPDQDSASCIG